MTSDINRKSCVSSLLVWPFAGGLLVLGADQWTVPAWILQPSAGEDLQVPTCIHTVPITSMSLNVPIASTWSLLPLAKSNLTNTYNSSTSGYITYCQRVRAQSMSHVLCRRVSCLMRPCWPGFWKDRVQPHTDTCSTLAWSLLCLPLTGWCVCSHATFPSTCCSESGISSSAMVRPASHADLRIHKQRNTH